MAIQEGFVFDSLDLNAAAGPLRVMEADLTPPAARYQWATSVDTETARLVADPNHENREIVLKIGVDTQSTMDLALAQIGLVRDKLKKASATRGGIGLVWTPADGTKTCTFDVLAGEVTELPVNWEGGWLAKGPSFTIRLFCAPYGRGTETLTSTATSGTTPTATLEVASVPGDIPALGRLIVTDSATQSRRHVEWGLEGPGTYNSGTGLLIDSDALVTSGFGGVQDNTWAGAYDVGGGNTQVAATAYTGTTAIAGTGNLSHVGTFRVKARILAAAASFGQPTTPRGIRLSWQALDGPYTSNAWATPNANAVSALTWQEVDLGLITIPAVTVGTQRWQGRIEAYGNATGISYAIDYLVLVPAGDGYGIATASYVDVAGVVTGADTFTSTSSGVGLSTRVAPSGGTWATSGDATDFVFADAPGAGEETVTRSAISGTAGRFALLGSATPTDVDVQVKVRTDTNFPIVVGPYLDMAVVARYVNSTNYLYGTFRRSYNGSVYIRQIEIRQVVGGTETLLGAATYPVTAGSTNVWLTVRLTAFTSGTCTATIYTPIGNSSVTATSTAVATGGALASGLTGFMDRNTSTTSFARYYDDFTVATPPPEPFVLYSGRNMQFRHDATLRQDSTGTYTGPPQSYEGDRFLVPAGTSRVLVKARRNNVITGVDGNVTDNTTIQVGYTPRYLVVPR